MTRSDTTTRKPSALFPVTDWPEVRAAGDADRLEQRSEALARLWPLYRRGLRTYLQRKFNLGQEEIDDTLQSFVADKVLLGNVLAEADQSRGRFRTFLLHAIENHVRSEVRRANAGKRRPAGGFVSVELLPESEHPDGVPRPDRMADLAWAQAVFAEGARRMERECRVGGRRTSGSCLKDEGLLRCFVASRPCRMRNWPNDAGSQMCRGRVCCCRAASGCSAAPSRVSSLSTYGIRKSSPRNWMTSWQSFSRVEGPFRPGSAAGKPLVPFEPAHGP